MEFAVIGLGRFGLSLATQLQRLGHNVLGIDSSVDNCEKAGELLENVIVLDSTDSKALREIEINNFDKVIVGIGQDSMEASLLTCLNLIELNINNVIAKAGTNEHRKILLKMGIKDVIMPEGDMGIKVANKISKTFHYDYFDFGDGVRADKIIVTEQMRCILNKDIQTINLRKKYQINIIGIIRDEEIIVPDGSSVVHLNDQLLILGSTKNLERFENDLLKGRHGLFK